MKNVIIPLTERQVGWLVFTVTFGLFNTWIFIFTLQNPSTVNLMYTMIPIDIAYSFLAFFLDGRHDMNPAHWIGYCLKLKESKTEC